MKKTTLIALFLAALSLQNPTWAEGDVAVGKKLYLQKSCIGCHGAKGQSPIGNTPAIGGKSAEFIKATLASFRSGERSSPVMNAMSAALSDEDIDNLAAYLSEH